LTSDPDAFSINLLIGLSSKSWTIYSQIHRKKQITITFHYLML